MIKTKLQYLLTNTDSLKYEIQVKKRRKIAY